MKSPLPWRQEDGTVYGADPHMDGEIMVAETAADDSALTEYDEDNAKFIVQACNSHDALVGALEELQAWCYNNVAYFPEGEAVEMVREHDAVLKLAKGEV